MAALDRRKRPLRAALTGAALGAAAGLVTIVLAFLDAVGQARDAGTGTGTVIGLRLVRVVMTDSTSDASALPAALVLLAVCCAVGALLVVLLSSLTARRSTADPAANPARTR